MSVIEYEQIDFWSNMPPEKATFSLCNGHVNPIIPDSKQIKLSTQGYILKIAL